MENLVLDTVDKISFYICYELNIVKAEKIVFLIQWSFQQIWFTLEFRNKVVCTQNVSITDIWIEAFMENPGIKCLHLCAFPSIGRKRKITRLRFSRFSWNLYPFKNESSFSWPYVFADINKPEKMMMVCKLIFLAVCLFVGT